MDLAIARGAYKRDRGAFVPWRQVNMLVETTPTDPKQFNLLSRPPLIEGFSWGTGPVQGVFQKPGVLNGDRFTVSGGKLYREGVYKGTLDGSGPVKWASLKDEIVVTRGATAYSYIAADSFAAVVFPDGANVRSVHSMARLFVYVRGDDSGRYYWSALNDGRTVDALDFANAESEPDKLLDVFKSGDVFWFMGATTGEAWVLSGDDLLPWTPVAQRKLSAGVRDVGCGEEIGGGVYFIANDNSVRRIEEDAARLSDPGTDAQIKASATCSAFQFTYEGKTVFCFRLDDKTYGIDAAYNNQPVEFQTHGRSNWAPLSASNNGGSPLFGDDTSGQVWEFGDWTATSDSDTGYMERIFSAGTPLNSQPLGIANVLVDGNAGDTKADTGDAANPLIEMRTSRDGGRTFGNWASAAWGAKGDYNRQARFGNKGMFNPPGFLAEFRMVELADLRISNVRANEPLSGRARS